MRSLIVALCGLLVLSMLVGAKHQKSHRGPAKSMAIKTLNADDLQWGPSEAPFRPGAQGAVLDGDPSKPGHFVLRFRMPAGYTVDPHWHTGSERVTVLEGSLKFGSGNVISDEQTKEYGVGGYISIPGRAHHYALAGDDGALIQVDGEGPFDLHYVNPDGSEKKAPKKH